MLQGAAKRLFVDLAASPKGTAACDIEPSPSPNRERVGPGGGGSEAASPPRAPIAASSAVAPVAVRCSKELGSIWGVWGDQSDERRWVSSAEEHYQAWQQTR